MQHIFNMFPLIITLTTHRSDKDLHMLALLAGLWIEWLAHFTLTHDTNLLSSIDRDWGQQFRSAISDFEEYSQLNWLGLRFVNIFVGSYKTELCHKYSVTCYSNLAISKTWFFFSIQEIFDNHSFAKESRRLFVLFFFFLLNLNALLLRNRFRWSFKDL